MFNAIVTGSAAYGTPNQDSDVDLVVLVTHTDLARLKDRADPDPKPPAPKGTDSDPGTAAADRGLTASLRFGKLNLIATTDPVAFAVWVTGTKELKARAPVTRDGAIGYFRDLRIKHGLRDKRE